MYSSLAGTDANTSAKLFRLITHTSLPPLPLLAFSAHQSERSIASTSASEASAKGTLHSCVSFRKDTCAREMWRSKCCFGGVEVCRPTEVVVSNDASVCVHRAKHHCRALWAVGAIIVSSMGVCIRSWRKAKFALSSSIYTYSVHACMHDEWNKTQRFPLWFT